MLSCFPTPGHPLAPSENLEEMGRDRPSEIWGLKEVSGDGSFSRAGRGPPRTRCPGRARGKGFNRLRRSGSERPSRGLHGLDGPRGCKNPRGGSLVALGGKQVLDAGFAASGWTGRGPFGRRFFPSALLPAGPPAGLEPEGSRGDRDRRAAEPRAEQDRRKPCALGRRQGGALTEATPPPHHQRQRDGDGDGRRCGLAFTTTYLNGVSAGFSHSLVTARGLCLSLAAWTPERNGA